MVVEVVEDLDFSAVSEGPKGDVALPELVGQISFEADKGGLGALMRLRGDQSLAREDAPDRRDGGDVVDQRSQMVSDGHGARVVAGSDQFRAQPDDGGYNFGLDLAREGVRSAASWFEGPIATFAIAGQELIGPALGDPVSLGQLA